MKPDTRPVSPTGQVPAAVHAFRCATWVICVFGVLGSYFVALALVFCLIAEDKVWGTVLVSLPCGLLGIWLLTRLPGLIRTRIVIDESGITLRIPVWASGLLGKGAEARVRWDEVLRLTRTLRIYHLIPFPFGVEEFALHTAKGRFTITKNIIPHPERVMAIISARTGKPVEDLT